ncbi:MAG: hypothetical protein JW889_13280 [Verrucomicrobia bacterium]|nr:hypothetical protein [Verrucomicrobiota bacterium]
MQNEKKQPVDEPKQVAPGDEAAADGEAPPMNRAERRARKHKRKGELRQLHNQGNPLKSDSRAHLGRMHRRKAI